jgi:hypothetical protein
MYGQNMMAFGGQYGAYNDASMLQMPMQMQAFGDVAGGDWQSWQPVDFLRQQQVPSFPISPVYDVAYQQQQKPQEVSQLPNGLELDGTDPSQVHLMSMNSYLASSNNSMDPSIAFAPNGLVPMGDSMPKLDGKRSPTKRQRHSIDAGAEDGVSGRVKRSRDDQ